MTIRSPHTFPAESYAHAIDPTSPLAHRSPDLEFGTSDKAPLINVTNAVTKDSCSFNKGQHHGRLLGETGSPHDVVAEGWNTGRPTRENPKIFRLCSQRHPIQD